MKILIAGGGTGGHLMPALALAEELNTRPGVDVVLVGSERGIEASLLPNRPYRFLLIPSEPLYRREIWRNVAFPVTALRALRRSYAVVEEENPALVVGTGGYAAGPVLFAAVRKGRPIALQEQNAYPGLTTRLLAPYAKQIHLGFPEARPHLRAAPEVILDSGNPIEAPPTERNKRSARNKLDIPDDNPTVLVMGGSQGSASLNKAFASMLGTPLEMVTVLWSTGVRMFDQYKHLHDPPRRIVKAFWDPIREAYSAADVVIGRAGAMSTAEFCAWGLPSILIPLPTAAANHQAQNARAMAAAGAAVHLPEPDLTPEGLRDVLLGLLESRSQLGEMSAAATRRGRPNSVSETASELLGIVS